MTIKRRLLRAARTGFFTLNDMIAALDWVLNQIRPRRDQILARLRYQFIRAMAMDQVHRAAALYNRIMLRTALRVEV